MLLASGYAAAADPLPGATNQVAQAAPRQPGPAVEPGTLETVTVTAQRRTESAQNVGIALSVISPEQLANTGAKTVNDLQYLVPSFEAMPQFGSGQPGYRIRGVGFDDYGSNNTPTVGVYIDDTAYPIPIMTQGLIFDLQRVEVLRGPQGTLYGRNTTGGAINFITNKPTDTFEGGASVEYGRFNESVIEAYVSGPITDQLRMRLAGITDQGGAFQHSRDDDQTLGSKDKGAIRILTDYDASDNLKFELDTHWSADHSEEEGLYLITPLKVQVGPTLVTTPPDGDHTKTGWGTSPGFAEEIGISPDQKPFLDNEGWGADLKAVWSLPFAALTNLASYEGFSRREYSNFDASDLPNADVYFRSRATVYSDELRLNSLDDSPLRWVAGFYYSNEHLNEVYRSGFITSFGLNAYTPYSQSAETESVFGQISPQLNDQLGFDLGFRFEHEERDLDNFQTIGIVPEVVTIPFTSANADRETSFSEPTGLARVNYKLDDDILLYGSVSRGVKSGGFSAYNSTTPANLVTEAFLPEKLWAYEIGTKTTLDEHRLQVNAAGYYYDYTDQQVQSEVVDPTFGPIGKIVNAPSSHILGAEVEAVWKPLPPLTISQSVGYSRGFFDKFIDVGGYTYDPATARYGSIFVDRAGQSLVAPKVTYSGSVSYTWELDNYALETGIDYSFRTTYFSHFGPLYNIAPYWLADAHITLTPEQGFWSLTFWGRNIFDSTYDLTRNFFVPGDNIAAPGEPATYGVTVTAKF